MCNLSQGILEKGEVIGEAKTKSKLIINMYKKGLPIEQIADIAEMQIAEITTVIKEKIALEI